MAQLWMDGFDHYGTDDAGRTAMLEGPWAELNGASVSSRTMPVIPPMGARTGTHALRTNCTNLSNQNGNIGRRVLPAGETELFTSQGYFVPQLPDVGTRLMLMAWADINNNPVGSIFLNTDGSLTARGPGTQGALESGYHAGAVLGSTNGPVITAGTWHHVETRFVANAGAGILEVRVDEQVVLNLTALATGSNAVTQLVMGMPRTNSASVPNVPEFAYFDDLIVRDASGTVNNTFQGDLRVAFLQPIANGDNQGWTTRSIENTGPGVMNFVDTNRNEGIAYNDNAALEIGNSDFCIETFVRFNTALTTTQTAVILSKFDNVNNQRSWRLILTGPDGGGALEFSISTDGSAGTVSTIHNFPFTPEVKRWYHIAVTRESGVNRMFIDGQQVGVGQADTATYFNGSAQLWINNQQNNTPNTPFDNLSVDGWYDATRITIGAARYTGNFAVPTEPLPANSTDDPLYNNVELLLNYNGDLNFDQSTNNFSGTLINNAFRQIPSDGSAFQTIDGQAPTDADFVEAALVAATGTLTFTANALDTEQVVIGATTYTLQTTLVDAANNVLIGASAEDTLDNLLAAVNQEAGEGTIYGTGTVQNVSVELTDLPDAQVLATARTPGAAGNTIVSTTTVTGASWTAATLAGGADIPANSEFTVSQLPPEVTGIRAVAIINRAFKTDSGSSEVQASFVESGGASDQGTARPLTTSPTYYEDTFEEDPNTMGAITPSTLVNARIRLDRTL